MVLPGGRPHTTSSATRVPSTWLSGCCMMTAVPPIRPSPTAPGRSTVPDVASRPDSTSINVVLPEPLAPVTARCSPGSTNERHGAERVVVGAGIAEANVGQPGGHRRDIDGVGRGGSSLCTSGMPSSRAITRDSAHQPMRLTNTMDHTDEGEEQIRPMLQRRGEIAFELFGQTSHVRDAGDHRGEAVDVGGHRLEDQVAQTREDRQRAHHEHTEDRTGDEWRPRGRSGCCGRGA